MPYPSAQDVTHDLCMLSGSRQELWMPTDFHVMVEHWILLVRLSIVLGEILSLFYQQLGKRPTITQVNDLEAELDRFEIPKFDNSQHSSLGMFSYYHLQLHLQ